MNFRAVRAIYLFEMARTWRTILQHRLARGLDLAVFRGFRAAIGSRITSVEGALRHLHRAGAGDAVGADPTSPTPRSSISRNSSAPSTIVVGADLYFEIVLGWRLSRRHQIDHSRPDHPRDRRAVRAAADPSPGLDADLPGADGGNLQPVRLHHRHLGRRFGCR
jgi:hypothetical protein